MVVGPVAENKAVDKSRERARFLVQLGLPCDQRQVVEVEDDPPREAMERGCHERRTLVPVGQVVDVDDHCVEPACAAHGGRAFPEHPYVELGASLDGPVVRQALRMPVRHGQRQLHLEPAAAKPLRPDLRRYFVPVKAPGTSPP